MKKKIKLNNGKVLQVPSKMYTQKDLDEMEVDYVSVILK